MSEDSILYMGYYKAYLLRNGIFDSFITYKFC